MGVGVIGGYLDAIGSCQAGPRVEGGVQCCAGVETGRGGEGDGGVDFSPEGENSSHPPPMPSKAATR